MAKSTYSGVTFVMNFERSKDRTLPLAFFLTSSTPVVPKLAAEVPGPRAVLAPPDGRRSLPGVRYGAAASVRRGVGEHEPTRADRVDGAERDARDREAQEIMHA